MLKREKRKVCMFKKTIIRNEKSSDFETIHLYLLNSNTTIIETFRTACLNCKIVNF
jgi:hypothetical protein